MTHHSMAARALAPVLVLAALAAPTPADVVVVASDGSGDFTTIQQAISATADGDLIQVRGGTYGEFLISNRSLTVTAELGERVSIIGTVRVRNLAANRDVLLSNLDVIGQITGTAESGHGLRAQNCAGSLRVQNCTFRARQTELPVGTGDNDGRAGASIVNCADVVFVESEFYGGAGRDIYNCCENGTTGGNGIASSASHLALFHCRAEGFEGGYSGWGGRGGHGVVVRAIGLYSSGSTFVGGKGGFGDDFIYGPGGDGGDAIFADAGSASSLLDSTLIPGEPGDSFLPSAGAQPGAQIGGAGTVAISSVPARRITSTNLSWSAGQASLRIEGQPGDRVHIVSSEGTAYRFRGSANGVWTLTAPNAIQALALGTNNPAVVTLPASGVLNMGIDLPALGAGVEARPLFLQGIVLSAGNSLHLTSPAMMPRTLCDFSTDCNANGLPDGCEVSGGSVPDCDFNGIPDACDIAAGTNDCDGNGVPDTCDLMSGTATDCDSDGVPDSCQIDCNANGIPDTCDLSSGTSADCDADLVPDECSIDCNVNGIPDLCDISGGTSLDLNNNDVPDECQLASDVYYVDAGSVAWGDGTAQLPFDNLVQATDYAISGNTIFVADGIYTGEGNRNASFGGNDLVVVSLNGPANCIIDLQGEGRAFVFPGGETQAARIEGVTIKNGYKTLGNGGAAILVNGASPTIVNCVISDCVSGFYNGGAIRFIGGLGNGTQGARILNCSFDGNSGGRGGAISAVQTTGHVLIEDCISRNNSAESGSTLFTQMIGSRTTVRNIDIRGDTASYGGAIFQRGGELVVTESIIAENTGGSGGGIHIDNGSKFHLSHTILASNQAIASQGGGLIVLDFNDSMEVRIDNCLFFANTANGSGGGAMLRDAHDVRVTNCSFFLNTGTRGGGVNFSSPSVQVLRNCLFWENQASQLGPQIHVETSTLDIDYCNLQGGSAGITFGPNGAMVYGFNNSSVYPGFVDPDGADDDINTWEDNDVRLGPNSAARDAGDNSSVGPDVLDLDADGDVNEPVPVDLAGNSRFIDSNEPDTGNGSAPIVDLGCYESQ